MKVLFWSFLMMMLSNPFANTTSDAAGQTAKLVPVESTMTQLKALPHFDVDLVIGSIEIDLGECNVPHGMFSWTVSFCNNGTGPARPCQMGIFVSTDSPLTASFYEFSMPSIAAGSCLSYSGTGVHTNGDVTIHTGADLYDVVDETNENNNTLSYSESCP